MSNDTLLRLREKVGEAGDVAAALALMQWDEEVNLPPKAGPGRGQQLATLSAVAHRMFTSPEIGALLDELSGADLDGDDAALVAETRHDYEHATKLPEAFVQDMAQAQSAAYQAWVVARRESRFATFQPHLERILALLKRKADYLGYEGSPYNALLDEFERGMTAERLKGIFGELAPKQSALVARIAQAEPPDTRWLRQVWSRESKWRFSLRILRDMGYDLDAGRQDISVHPFTTNFDVYDVRITTRFSPNELFSGFMGSIHEGGHALYEQGFLDKDRRTVLAAAPSLGIHESQSRMWENLVARSRPFWCHYFPALRVQFPGQLDGVTAEDVYRAVNHVEPSFIRVEADECTYNLHIVIRFEIELALVEGNLAVQDVPEAWNAKVKQYLGIDTPNDAHGCLQDIHWAHGGMGYFPTYALGNLYAAQLFRKAEQDIPTLWASIETGDFAPLRNWLRTHVHQIGRRKTATQIVQEATGAPPSADAFIEYLKRKYGELYGV